MILESVHAIDYGDPVVILLELPGVLLGPRELLGVQIYEHSRVCDIPLEIAGRFPSVSHLSRFDGVLDIHLRSGDLLGPVPERKERSVSARRTALFRLAEAASTNPQRGGTDSHLEDGTA